MTKPIDSQSPDWEIALAKYGVIVPLVARILTNEERDALRHQILAATHQFPDGKLRKVAVRTLRQWCQQYRTI